MVGKDINFALFSKSDYDALKKEHDYLDENMFQEEGGGEYVKKAMKINREFIKMRLLIQKVMEYLDSRSQRA